MSSKWTRICPHTEIKTFTDTYTALLLWFLCPTPCQHQCFTWKHQERLQSLSTLLSLSVIHTHTPSGPIRSTGLFAQQESRAAYLCVGDVSTVLCTACTVLLCKVERRSRLSHTFSYTHTHSHTHKCRKEARKSCHEKFIANGAYSTPKEHLPPYSLL